MLRLGVLAVLAVALVSGQKAIRCDVPKEFEGRSSTWNHARGTHDLSRFAYDAVNQRFNMVEEVNALSPGR